MQPDGRRVSQVSLLDVNVLVALFDPDHVHHDLAHDWFADNRTAGWATCPLTENGFVRVLANPAYGSAVARAATLNARLRKFCESGQHEFWPDQVSLLNDDRGPAYFSLRFRLTITPALKLVSRFGRLRM